MAPALLLLSVGRFSPWYIPGAFVILATGVIRLSYFNVFGLVDDATYRGLSLDNNVLALALLFVFEPLIGRTIFAAVLYVALMVLAALQRGADRDAQARWALVLRRHPLCACAEWGLRLAAALAHRAARDLGTKTMPTRGREQPLPAVNQLGRSVATAPRCGPRGAAPPKSRPLRPALSPRPRAGQRVAPRGHPS